MGAKATLTPARLAVKPGTEQSAQLAVTNNGAVVDAFALTILGPAAEWARCEPAVLSAFPGQTQNARIVFAPPLAAQVPAGPLTFGVHVRPREDRAGSTVAEGVLEIRPQPVVVAEFAPRTARARGRRRARQQVAIDNTGNSVATVTVVGRDEQDAVQVEADPAQVDVEPGSAVFVAVRTRGARRFWTGAPKTLPFTVEARAADAAAVTMPGTLLHEAQIPRWLPKVVALIAALAVVAAVLWFSVFRPVIRDTATDAANSALASAGIPTGGGGGAPTPTAPGSPTPTGPGSPTPTPTPIQPVSTGTAAPFAESLTATAPSLAPIVGHLLTITDIVFENPDQDYGSVAVIRGNSTLVRLRLQDFRDYDLHFITPIQVPSGSALVFAVSCQNTDATATPPPPHANQACSTAALVTGVSQPK